MTDIARWSPRENARLEALVEHFGLAEMRDSLRAQIVRDYVPADIHQGAVDRIVARIENLPSFKRSNSASELPAVDRDAVLSIVRFHLGEQ